MARKTVNEENATENPELEVKTISFLQYLKTNKVEGELFVKYLTDKYGKQLRTEQEWNEIISNELKRRA